MKKITGVHGHGFHLPGDNLDTDQIIPAQFLVCVTFDGLGDHVFESNRQSMGGKHPFDLPQNKGRSILLADQAFGCGSSREHAVPALMQWGITAVIAKSFSPIFPGNATGNGLICATVSEEDHREIAEIFATEKQSPDHIEIDLLTKKIVFAVPGEQVRFDFEIDEATRQSLINGTWNALDVCLEAGDLVDIVAARLPYFQRSLADV